MGFVEIPLISIHAPLRERPEPLVKNKIIAAISIHAPLRERLSCSPHIFWKLSFQSTLPYGSDIKTFIPVRFPVEFQSTLPYGSDLAAPLSETCGIISIHAPLQERRGLFLRTFAEGVDFNPRSLTGATSVLVNGLCVVCIFQSTLPYGSDIGHINSKMLISLFQSTLPYGSDRKGQRLLQILISISIHAPLRERLG